MNEAAETEYVVIEHVNPFTPTDDLKVNRLQWMEESTVVTQC